MSQRPTCRGCAFFDPGLTIAPDDFVRIGEPHCSNPASPKHRHLVSRFDSCEVHEPVKVVSRRDAETEPGKVNPLSPLEGKLSPRWTLLIVVAPWVLLALVLAIRSGAPRG